MKISIKEASYITGSNRGIKFLASWRLEANENENSFTLKGKFRTIAKIILFIPVTLFAFFYYLIDSLKETPSMIKDAFSNPCTVKEFSYENEDYPNSRYNRMKKVYEKRLDK